MVLSVQKFFDAKYLSHESLCPGYGVHNVREGDRLLCDRLSHVQKDLENSGSLCTRVTKQCGEQVRYSGCEQ